jgi:hypothetical protein
MQTWTLELDVRAIPPRDKYPAIFRTFDELASGEAMSETSQSTTTIPIAPFCPWPNPWLTNGYSPGASNTSS